MHTRVLHGVAALVAGFVFVTAGGLQPAAAQTGPDGAIAGLKPKFIDVNGIRTRYYDEGKGEPMVLVHGGMTGGSSTANVWSRNIRGLAKRFRVIAVDRLGSGLTGNPSDNEYGYPAQAAFLYRFIQTLKLTGVHLVGHSAGGAVSFYTAIEHPELFKTLTIVGIGPANPRAVPVGQTSRLEPLLKKCPDQNVYEGLKCRVEMLAWGDKTFDADYWKADTTMAMTEKSKAARAAVTAAQGDKARAEVINAYREKAWEQAKNGGLQMPILMYAGKQDVLDWGETEPTAMLRGELALFDILGAKNPKVSMVVVNEGGHFMYREHPEKFNDDLIGFVDFWAGQAK